MGKSGTGAGMRTGTMGKVGYNSGGESKGVHARPTLRSYRESMQPATCNKTPCAKPRAESKRGRTAGP